MTRGILCIGTGGPTYQRTRGLLCFGISSAYDNGLSNCYLILKARAMGFDTLIMGMRFSDLIRAEFGIPENETIMAVISLGYRDGEPRQPEHRDFNEVVKFF